VVHTLYRAEWNEKAKNIVKWKGRIGKDAAVICIKVLKRYSTRMTEESNGERKAG
jgi:hypothetical protein